MALVDYGSSDESNDEEPEIQTNEIKQSTSKEQPENVTKSNLFSCLPKPKAHVALSGNEDKLQDIVISKPSKSDGPVKISIPSLTEFENDKPPAKKMKQTSKGVGLFSVLPPPKNATVKESTQLIPNVIKNQINKAKTDNMLKLKSATVKSAHARPDGDDDDDDDNTGSTSYFGEGISTTDQKPVMNYESESYMLPDTDVGNIPIPSGEKTVAYPQHNVSDIPPNYDQEVDYNVPSSSDTLELDDKALQILCGGKRKRNQMPVNIIDLSGEEIMPDSKEWLLKQFTEEKKTRTHSHKKNNGPSIQSRRKHQITYLAYQAKAQELELQNQWAQNRMSRRQTQSKYGF